MIMMTAMIMYRISQSDKSFTPILVMDIPSLVQVYHSLARPRPDIKGLSSFFCDCNEMLHLREVHHFPLILHFRSIECVVKCVVEYPAAAPEIHYIMILLRIGISECEPRQFVIVIAVL